MLAEECRQQKDIFREERDLTLMFTFRSATELLRHVCENTANEPQTTPVRE
jgi:hypothetical protein